jgi:hypothetical protein
MRTKLISLISVILVLSLASVTYGIVIGDWEQDMDGWEVADNNPPGNPTFTYSATGATLGDSSLRMAVTNPGWRFVLWCKLQNMGFTEEFFSHNIFAIDVTRLVADWTGADGFSQLILIVNSDGVWHDLGGAGNWSPPDGDNTQTISWDYSAAIPLIRPNFSYLEFAVVTNCDAAYTTGGVYYLDNARLLGSGNNRAHDPNPADGETEIQRDPVLVWGSGNFAETHDLYFGTDYDDVNDADMESMSSTVTAVSLDVNNYTPGTLEFDTTYYWRVDEFGESDYWKGLVWSFTTGNFLVVDDFEDYNDYEPYTVWNSWIDGYEDPTNGSTAGYPDPDFILGEHYLESEVVHSGYFSMPLFYDNSAGNSEVTMELGSQRDWTEEDVKSLSLRFYGSVSNAVEQMYVAIANSTGNPAVVYYDQLDALEMESWTEWSIKLSEFESQGINLTDVDKISIGFGDRDNPRAGGSGMVFIDDIRLYKSRCILADRSADFAKIDYAPIGAPAGDCVVDYRELEIMMNDWLIGDQIIAATNPGTSDLVAYYPLNEGTGTTTSDASGNNHNGTFSEGVSWVSPGIMDSAYAINMYGSTGDMVDIGTWDPASGTGQLTLSIWVNWVGPHDGAPHQGLIGKRDDWETSGLRFMFEIDTTNGNNQLAFRQYVAADTDVYSEVGTMTPFIGRWMHAAVTFDGTTVRIYANGREMGSGPFEFGSKPSASMAIGNTNGSSGSYQPEVFNGDLDEVRIYNRALLPAEIAYLADATPGDGQLHIPVPSRAELYEGEEPGSRTIDFKDFAVLADMWLEDML